MRVSLSPEDGRKADVGLGSLESMPKPASTGLSPAEEAIELRRQRNLDRLQQIIESAVQGTLPRDRELKPWEPQTLSSKHIQMVFDRVAGLKNVEIAEKYGIDDNRVCVILNHPDAQIMQTTILSMAADRLTDVNERLKDLAPEAMNVKVELMRHSRVDAVRHKAASDILDMAGYGKKRGASVGAGLSGSVTVNQNIGPTFVLPERQVPGFMEAMREANRVASMPYENHLAGSQRDEVIAEHRQLSDGLQLSAGHTEFVDGASPVPSPEDTAEPTETEKLAAQAKKLAEKFGIVGQEADALRESLEDEADARRRTA